MTLNILQVASATQLNQKSRAFVRVRSWNFDLLDSVMFALSFSVHRVIKPKDHLNNHRFSLTILFSFWLKYPKEFETVPPIAPWVTPNIRIIFHLLTLLKVPSFVPYGPWLPCNLTALLGKFLANVTNFLNSYHFLYHSEGRDRKKLPTCCLMCSFVLLCSEVSFY